MFSSNTCLVILDGIFAIKISIRSDLPSSRSENREKRGGVPLNEDDELFMFDDEILMLSVRHINKTQEIIYEKSQSVCS
jgi:hypothetical protein